MFVSIFSLANIDWLMQHLALRIVTAGPGAIVCEVRLYSAPHFKFTGTPACHLNRGN